uniref:WD repeat-containing protein 48 isoform X2 n=1 Tax=Rhizophora mucronata TaxID=61149 RepID=A0A2P2MJF6_RHIMU
MEEDCPNGVNGSSNSLAVTSLRTISSSNSISMHTTQSHGYVPIAAKGHKESVYALAMNDSGTILVSGGTERVHSDVMIIYSTHAPPPRRRALFFFE